MSDPKPNPSKLDRQVHGAVRQILYNELGFGQQKLKRFLSQALQEHAAVQTRVAVGYEARRAAETLQTEVNALALEVKKLKDEILRLRSSVDAGLQTELANAILALSAEGDRLVSGAVADQALAKAVDRVAGSVELTPLVRNALERAAREAVNEFVASNFRTDVTLKPGRKIFLPDA